MFLEELKQSLVWNERAYHGRASISELIWIDTSDIEWRFKLLITIMQFWNSIGIWSARDWTNDVPNLWLVQKLLSECWSFVHNNVIVWGKLKIIAQELSYEIILATNWKPNFQIIWDVINWRKTITKFLEAPEKVNVNNKVFSFKWKSWVSYNWKWLQDLMKFKTEDYVDIVQWLKMKSKQKEILLDSKLMKSKFKSHRNALMAYVKYEIDPEMKWDVVQYIELWDTEEKTID